MAKKPKQMLAPIALFAYRRPDHLTKTVAALRANPEAIGSTLYVFSDAPKDDSSAKDVSAVRACLQTITGFAQVNLIFREKNLGLAGNITGGVSTILAEHDRVIVVEDDVVVSPYFLRFMNDALTLYKNDHKVGSVSGYIYPVSVALPETYFIRGADCWGWATWRDRWRYYNADGSALLAELTDRNLTHAFDLEGAMSYTQMLKDQIEGQNDSWAVRWHASCFLRDLMILYPGMTLVHNIGNDGSGTHSASDESFASTLSPEPIAVRPIPVEESAAGRKAIREFYLQRLPSTEQAILRSGRSRGLLSRLSGLIGVGTMK